MEVSLFVFMVICWIFYAPDYGSDTYVADTILVLGATIFWLSLPNITISDDVVIMARRLGLFKRKIPIHNISNATIKFIPGSRGSAASTLHIFTTDKLVHKIDLYSHARHIRVLRDIRTRLEHLNNTQRHGSAEPTPCGGYAGPDC
jgi:hypothetical protein